MTIDERQKLVRKIEDEVEVGIKKGLSCYQIYKPYYDNCPDDDTNGDFDEKFWITTIVMDKLEDIVEKEIIPSMLEKRICSCETRKELDQLWDEFLIIFDDAFRSIYAVNYFVESKDCEFDYLDGVKTMCDEDKAIVSTIDSVAEKVEQGVKEGLTDHQIFKRYYDEYSDNTDSDGFYEEHWIVGVARAQLERFDREELVPNTIIKSIEQCETLEKLDNLHTKTLNDYDSSFWDLYSLSEHFWERDYDLNELKEDDEDDN